MKKTKLIFTLIVLIVKCSYVQAQFSGLGNGTQTIPYQITNATQLNEMHNFLGMSGSDTHFQLMNDIDLSGVIATEYPTARWLPIGSNDEGAEAFYGYLNGNGFEITNLSINRPASEYIGLFGAIKGGRIEQLNISIDGTNGIIGGDNCGGLAGYVENAVITGCHVQGNITGTGNLGGLIGFANQNVTIQNDTALITITASGNNVGGLIGYTASPLLNCTSSGTLNTGGDSTGGLVGYNLAPITTSTSAVNVTNISNAFVGNFMGGLVGSQHNTVTDCSAIGAVNGTNLIGGLVGDSYALISNSYASGEVNGRVYVGGLVGASDAVTNCHATGLVTGIKEDVGGLVGESYGPIDLCYATGAVNGAKSVGGLVGLAFMSVTHSFASGAVTCVIPEVIPEGGLLDFGGLIGNANGAVTNCYATGNVSSPSGSMYIGGMIGFSSGNVTYCYASGSVITEAYSLIGGLIGVSWGLLSHCVANNPIVQGSAMGNPNKIHRVVGDLEFDGAVANLYALQSLRLNNSTSIVGTENDLNGLNRSIAEVQTQFNYQINLQWDFDSIWTIREGNGYPFFGSNVYLTDIISSSVDNEEHGTISPIGDIAVADGTDKSYAITAATGYEIDYVLVDGINLGALSNYTFTNVIANHTIQAVFVNAPLGTNNPHITNINAYPNPVRDILNISLNQNIQGIEVFNTLGQLVAKKTLNDTQGQLDLSFLSAGTYFLKAHCDNNTVTTKVIKQ